METLIPFPMEEVERLHPESFGWAMACCRHDAEEAADTLQSAYLKLLQGSARFRGQGEFKTWLFGVIRRTACERRRQQWRRHLAVLRFVESRSWASAETRSETASPAEATASRERTEEFRALLNRLPARQREVLHLVFYQSLSVSQAAEAMGVSTGSARQHFDRAKKRLARHWKTTREPSPYERIRQKQSAPHGR